MTSAPPASTDEATRLRRHLERERAARLEAEAVSERGLRELYERKQQLELLEKIANAANQTVRPEDALRLAISEVCAFMSWDVGHVFGAEGTGAERRLRSMRIWHGADDEAWAPFRRMTEATAFAPGAGLPGRTLADGGAAWIPDLRRDGNFLHHRVADACGLRAASTFPVLSGAEVVAVLEFFARTTREPDETILRLMSQIGLQLGRAIERQRSAESIQRRAEELVRARDEAQSASRAKSEFLANMSHELRTPLNSIIGFSELMMKETLGPHSVDSYREYSRHIFESGRHLLAIVNDILDLSKIEAGKAHLDREEPVPLAALLDQVNDLIGAHAEQKGILLRIEVQADLPDVIGSERMLRQILINLLSNAIKFTAPGGSVRVAAALKSSGELALSVTDSGIGMSEADVEVALKPFGQVNSAFNRGHEGTGLGLPLARAMAALHQAEFIITSTPAVGTSVEIVFPKGRIARRSGQQGATAAPADRIG